MGESNDPDGSSPAADGPQSKPAETPASEEARAVEQPAQSCEQHTDQPAGPERAVAPAGHAQEGPAAPVLSTEADGVEDAQPGGDLDTIWDEGEEPPRSWKKRARKVLIVMMSIALGLGLVMAGGFWYLMNRYVADIDRVPNVFDGLQNRPIELPEDDGGDPLTFLLVGSDIRSDDPTTGGVYAGDDGEPSRSDTIMVMRLSGDRKSASLVSIPRDSWVQIPGNGMNKINAAYAFGGANLLVQTVEQLSNIRIDHFALVDFQGFEDMTDALGGVDVQVAEETTFQGVTFNPGINHLNGEEALIYVRQRTGLPEGDLSRVQRQQNYLRAMFGEVQDRGLITSPTKLDDFLRSFGRAVSVDDTFGDFELVRFAFSLRNLKSERVSFYTAPVSGLGMEGGQSVVYLDQTRGQQMWAAMRSGDLGTVQDAFTRLPDVPH